MTKNYFSEKSPEEHWLVLDAGEAVAIAYYAPERMTQGTWNVLLIAIHPDFQRKGHGKTIMGQIESELACRGERILLVETSGLEIFESTRAFYRKCGFKEEARIRDYYQTNEDKIIFRKLLQPINR